MENSQRGFELLQAADADGLRQLLEHDPAAAEARDAAGVSLLMQSLYRGRRDLAELIASKKKALDIFEAACARPSRSPQGLPSAMPPPPSTPAQKTASPPCTSLVFSASPRPPACCSKAERPPTPSPRIRRRSCRCTPPPPPATSKPPAFCSNTEPPAWLMPASKEAGFRFTPPLKMEIAPWSNYCSSTAPIPN